ncbi:MAG: fucose isomerase [Thermotogae bacterium]|nr:MAG: fucose isomerase [Thermotogota bacterium]
MQSINLGVLCLARKTFDYQAAKELYEKIKNDLRKIDNVEWNFIDNLIFEVEEAKKAAKSLASSNIDGLIVISGTFHLGHLILEIHKELRKPLLLWGLDELPYNGGKIRLNSVCGVNLNASNLYKSGEKSYHVVIGNEVDKNWIDAIRIKKALNSSHIGILGYRAQGFFNLDIDELSTYREVGVLLDHYELDTIFNYKVDNDEVSEIRSEIEELFDVSGINKTQLDKVVALSAKLKNFMNDENLNAIAIRCWPEFAEKFGISPCAAMSYIQSKGFITGCEGDVEGVLSMIAQKAIGAETPFLADFSQVDFEKNYALLWHCGVAPCNLAYEKSERSLDTYFAGGRGVTADFVMKPGEFSVCRLDSANGKYRIFLAHGQAVPMEKVLKGTYMKAIFDENVKDVLNRVIYHGIAHHVSVSYGRYIEPFKILARINDWEVIGG